MSGKHHQQNIELQCSVTDRRDGGHGGGGGQDGGGGQGGGGG